MRITFHSFITSIRLVLGWLLLRLVSSGHCQNLIGLGATMLKLLMGTIGTLKQLAGNVAASLLIRRIMKKGR